MKKHYTSDSVLPRRILLGRCGKRPRISSEATNPPPPPPTEISKLGDDLLVEILIRLPSPRSACRCKPVCSRWRSLISSPCFNSHFLSHHQRLELPPMPTNPHELQSIILGVLPPMPDSVGGSLKVLDCFKDLVLCGFWDVYNRELCRSYLICNPFTKQWIALPLAPRKPEWYFSSASRLVCEPRSSNNLDLGDGQTFVYSEYRFAVVCIYQEISSKVYLKLDVFCSGVWRMDQRGICRRWSA
ncbi:unnamed protein product [Linum tenue]|uniref:F-box domain-containing protein n=1 Tax=Linum tenue TaxID=586396 RepID=A0AAV0MYQ3_9ROSI|nr:unnamed protein product [Linum tenue]